MNYHINKIRNTSKDFFKIYLQLLIQILTIKITFTEESYL